MSSHGQLDMDYLYVTGQRVQVMGFAISSHLQS